MSGFISTKERNDGKVNEGTTVCGTEEIRVVPRSGKKLVCPCRIG